MERKAEIRHRILKKRKSIDVEQKAVFDQIIQEKVQKHPWFQEAQEVFCYVPIRGEVDTMPIIKAAWDLGKRVAVPKVLSKTEMKFFYIQSYDDQKPGVFGVLEPVTGQTAEPGSACVIVPGSVFDSHGNRIGYGGGYYDRYLVSHPDYHTIAIAYSLQVIDELPTEDTDVPVQNLLTESKDYIRS